VNANIKGAEGRCSSAMTRQPLKGDVTRIRVIGREERTNAESAQYQFLLFSLRVKRKAPLFVNIIWFPGNSQGIERDEEINLSYRHAQKLNSSQRQVVGAMLSTDPQDSLIIAHGKFMTVPHIVCTRPN
jgi:hypothetical protein